MSKHIRVSVLCPYGRRETVNLTPNSSILQILEEACRKQNINPDDFDICHYNKPLDLSLPVRFANLANNAQLELHPAKSARKDCLVTVGLQLESGERLMKDFVPSTSVWDVMEQCLQMRSSTVDLAGKGEPVCIYMRQQLVGNAIKDTTLRSLGLIKGSAIIRLIFRNPDELSDQAHLSSPLSKLPKENPIPFHHDKPKVMDASTCEPQFTKVPKHFMPNISVPKTENIPQCSVTNHNENQDSFPLKGEVVNSQSYSLKMEEPEKISMEIISNTEDNTNTNDTCNTDGTNKKETPLDQNMELDEKCIEDDKPEKTVGVIHYIGGRHAVLYSLNDISEIKKADFPEEFFELTVDDVRYLMSEYKRTRNELENQPLLTKELRKQKLLQKLGVYKQTVIRVYFPERLVLQAVFQVSETVQDICEFVRDYLEDKNLDFYLYTAPPKDKKDKKKSLIELMLIPAAVVYFGCDSPHESYLMRNLKDKISDPQAAALAASESRKQVVEYIEDPTEIEDASSTSVKAVQDEYTVPGPNCSQPINRVQSSGKVPKWLKLSKK